MEIRLKVKKGKTLYEFKVKTKGNYKGNVSEMNEEKLFFLNQIQNICEDLRVN